MKILFASVSVLFVLLLFSLNPSPAGARQKPTESIHQAIYAGDIDQVKSLISKGANINEKDQQGMIPLHLAILNRNEDIAVLLIAEGADVNARGKNSMTPLHFVAFRGSGEIAGLLIEKGADVNAKDTADKTPLHFSAESGYKDVAEILIAKGADINAQTRADNALSLAQRSRHQEIVELLLENGAKEPVMQSTEYELYGYEEGLERTNLGLDYGDRTVGGKVTLRQKFLPGTYEMVQISEQNNEMQMNNQTVPIKLTKTYWYDLDASDPDASDQTTCTITVKRVKESHAGGTFDTDDPESLKANPKGQLLNQWLEFEYVLKFGPEWKLLNASGLDQMLEGTSSATSKSDQKARTQEMFSLKNDIMPGEPVGVGDIWHKKVTGEHPFLSDIEGDTECKLTKIEQTTMGTIAYITFIYQAESDKTTSKKIGPQVTTVKNVKATQKGEIQINVDTGLLLMQKMSTTGELEMSGKGPDGKDVPVTMKLDETVDATIKLTAARYDTSQFQRRRFERTQRSSSADPLADPNEIKVRIKTFEGLEEALQQISSKSRTEKSAWLQTRLDNRTSVARAVNEQLKQELMFVRQIAVEEKAEETIEEIDYVLSKHEELYSEVRKELLVQKRQMKQTEDSRSRSRGRGQSSGSYSGRAARGRSTQGRRGQQDEYGMAGQYAEQGSGYAGVGREAQQMDPEIENKIRQWLQSGVEKSSLLGSEHTEIVADFKSIRIIAVEEGAEKTTAAIDGILLSRQERFEELTQKMEEQRIRQQNQDTQGRYQRGRLQQEDRRLRR